MFKLSELTPEKDQMNKSQIIPASAVAPEPLFSQSRSPPHFSLSHLII